MTEKLLREFISQALREGAFDGEKRDELVKFVVRSNEIEGYHVSADHVWEALEGIDQGYPVRYVTQNPHIYGHLIALKIVESIDPQTVEAVKRVHSSMGSDVLDSGSPGSLRSGVQVQSSEGTQYVPSQYVPAAIGWWSVHKFIDPFDAHVVYELIHPFEDGNGRSGRILLAAMMNFDYAKVNSLIDGDYIQRLQDGSSTYQGKFWEEDGSVMGPS